MKYKFIKEYEHFNLWINTRNGCHECFWKEIDPNKKLKKKASENDG